MFEEKYHKVKIIWKHIWSENLFSFRVERPKEYRFISGQFGMIGVENNNDILKRAYSVTSGYYEDYLEFYSIVVPDGPLTSKLINYQVDDYLYLDKKRFGFLILDRLKPGKDLWLLATGTGLAPFLSIIQDPETYERFENIYLIHSVRNSSEVTYVDFFETLKEHPLLENTHKLKIFHSVTREKIGYNKRITTGLLDNSLEEYVGAKINEDSRFMICGNPEMTRDTQHILEQKGFNLSRKDNIAEIVTENGF